MMPLHGPANCATCAFAAGMDGVDLPTDGWPTDCQAGYRVGREYRSKISAALGRAFDNAVLYGPDATP